jgi:hypothetical protein
MEVLDGTRSKAAPAANENNPIRRTKMRALAPATRFAWRGGSSGGKQRRSSAGFGMHTAEGLE